jgi:adenylyl-sulfate kinase
MSDSHKGVTLWFTGLSQSGKSTTSALVAERLRARGVRRLEVLDGDIVRLNLNKGLGFSKEDRDENIRRIAFVAQLLTRNETVCIVAAISPYTEARDKARAVIGELLEIYCEAPLEVCAERDTKGLYKQAMAGEITNFTGVNDPYEAPEHADLVLNTAVDSPEVCADRVIALMEQRGYLVPVGAESAVPAGV